MSDSDIIPETQEETQGERRNAPAKRIVAKPREERTMARWKLQAMSQFYSGVSRLAKVNAKRMKLEEKDKKALLDFKKEETEKNWSTRKKLPKSNYKWLKCNVSHTLLRHISNFNQLHLVLLFHPFSTNLSTVRPNLVTMNSDFEQVFYVYSRFSEVDLKKHGLYKTV